VPMPYQDSKRSCICMLGVSILPIREHLSSSRLLGGVGLLIISFFLCCPVMCLYVLSSVLGCLLRFPYKNDVRVVFASSCFYESACPIYVICVCFRIVVSNAYCVAFLFLFF
jgi:hypothetical protein